MAGQPLREEQRTEAEATMIQTVGELQRGIDVAREELKRGRLGDARQTLGMIGDLVKIQDRLVVAIVRENVKDRRALEALRNGGAQDD